MALAIAIGLAASLWIIGYWIGQKQPEGGEMGFYDTRGINRGFWTLVLSGFGCIGGLPLGFWIGTKLASRPPVGITAAIVLWLFPLVTYLQWNAQRQDLQRKMAAVAEKRLEDDKIAAAKSQAARDLYISSGQYDIDKRREFDRLDLFQKEMSLIIYPGAVLLGTPHSRALRYATPDGKETVETFLVNSGCELGYAHGSPKGQRLIYYKWQGLTGTIYVEDAHGGLPGTWITYNMPA